MKKIIIAADLRSVVEQEESFLKRSDVVTLTAATNEEALDIHAAQRADLIIISLGLPGMDGATFCDAVRSSEELREVSIIAVNPAGTEESRIRSCKANAIFNGPLAAPQLLDKAHQLLNVSPRGSYRAPISVEIRSQIGAAPFLCHAENISESGMLFCAGRRVPPGEVIRCSFFMPDMTHIKTEAEIVRVVETETDYDTVRCGVRFNGLDERFRKAIRAYIEQLSRRQPRYW